MGVIIFTANPLTPLKKCKLEINLLIFGQIITILGLIWVTRDKSDALRVLWLMRSMQVCCSKSLTFSHTLIAHYHGHKSCLA